MDRISVQLKRSTIIEAQEKAKTLGLPLAAYIRNLILRDLNEPSFKEQYEEMRMK